MPSWRIITVCSFWGIFLFIRYTHESKSSWRGSLAYLGKLYDAYSDDYSSDVLCNTEKEGRKDVAWLAYDV